MRSDLSATLFLTPPEDYDGGDLIIEDTYGIHKAKLPLEHMVVYPSSSLHRVEPVTRGRRISSFFWIQSMVRSDAQRTCIEPGQRAHRVRTATFRQTPRPCNSRASTTICCGNGPRCEAGAPNTFLDASGAGAVAAGALIVSSSRHWCVAGL